MNPIPRKLHSLLEACKIRERLRSSGRRVVLTNGCFDLLHIGHVYSLENAAKYGDSLWVALNSDRSVRQLKGILRPIFHEISRAYILSALECVSGIFIFDGKRFADEISLFKPDVYVKSGEYNLKNLDESELMALRGAHAEIKFVPLVAGVSTTSIIASVKKI
jgi:rfaE bifunctional protein nucleotidyltransferase chain/domain